VLGLSVAVYHPATLPPPPPEPYPYPAPDLFSDPHPNNRSSASPPSLSPTPILYADPALSFPYPYPSPPPAIPLLPQSITAALGTQLVIPPYRAYDGQLWFPSPPPTYVGAYQDLPPPPRPASTNVGVAQAPAGLPVSGTPDHLNKHYSYRQHQHYPPQPEETTGHGARAARISHHLRATSRARSASPPAQIFPSTQVAVDVIAPKPMPSSEVITETHDATDNDDLFARSSGRVGTRTRSLSVVKLEEMAARAAAETEAKAMAERQGREAAVDKTLPVPPVPSGKPSGYRANRRVLAQDIFHQMGPEEAAVGRAETDAGAEIVPRTPSLSALSLLRPPPNRDRLAFPSYGGKDECGLDALERRLAEQVGTRKPPALPPSDLRTVLELGSASPLPPPPPVPAPVPVPGKKAQSMAQEQADDVGAGAAVNESAISSLALGAEEDFGGRNTNPNLTLPDVQVEGEEEGEGEDADVDGRTQRHGKGTGASSSSERGTYKALSRKSVKSDSKEKDRDRERERKSKEGKAKRKKKRDGRREERDDEAARIRSAAKGRVAEWLGKLEVCEPGTEPELDIKREPDSSASPVPEQETASQTEPAPIAAEAITAAAAASSPTTPPPVIESKPNPRSSGFVPVSTLRRAPISLPPESASASTPAPSPASAALVHEPPSSSPAAPPNTNAIPAPVPVRVRQLARVFPPPSQMEVKYDFKSARGGRGGRVTSVAAIWAEAAKAADSSTSASAGSGSGAVTPTLSPTPTPMQRQAKPSRPAAAKGPKAAQTKAAATPAAAASNKVPIKPMTSIVNFMPASPIPVPIVPARTPRPMVRQSPSAPTKEKEKEKDSRPPRALFGLGAAAAATPSSPALSSSIATPVLSSTASLARPPLATTTTTMTQLAMNNNNTPSPSSSPLRPAAQTHPYPHPPHPSPPSQPAPAPAAGQRPPIVNGGGFKAAELAFGQARLRDLIKRYQGQTA
jgi:hypothetical protein